MSAFDHRQPTHTSGGDDCPTPSTPIDTFTYDDDGNLRLDDQYEYVWDAENRLTEIATRIDLGGYFGGYDEGDKRLRFEYDHMGRRVRKTAESYNGSSWDVDTHLYFVYEPLKWNVLLVLDAADGSDQGTEPDYKILRKYTWGLDMSGQYGNPSESGIHGAGGIGGLLAAVEDSKSYWFLYDGNGNVGQVLDATTTSDIDQVAHYEYDPYGNAIVVDNNTYDDEGTQTGTDDGYANTNPIRFSTKWLDKELASSDSGVIGTTGLYYYGYRYYSPRLGRWIKRDPIQETGGLNLYGHVGNRPTCAVDLLGMGLIGIGPDPYPPQPPVIEPSPIFPLPPISLPIGPEPPPSTIDPVVFPDPWPPLDPPWNPLPSVWPPFEDPCTECIRHNGFENCIEYCGGSLRDPSTSRLTGLLSTLASECGIFVVRELAPNGGIGHTFLATTYDSIGWSSGPRPVSEEKLAVTAIGKVAGTAIAVWSTVYSAFENKIQGTNGAYYTTREYFKYRVGPNKGKCCSTKPDCEAIRQCVFSKDMEIAEPFNADGPNCNTFARVRLESCCLGRSELLHDPSDRTFLGLRELWGWSYSPRLK